MVLHPQDVIYLAALLIISAFGLFLFTAVAGRLWCGFACRRPSTPRSTCGSSALRRRPAGRLKLDAAPWSAAKLAKKGGKQVVWLAIGLWTGFTFVAYFTPARTLAAEVLSLRPRPVGDVLDPVLRLRDLRQRRLHARAGLQVHVPVCALPERDVRPRHADHQLRRAARRAARLAPRGVDPASVGKGDCIDCTLCVQVCPTGIDIRDGLQYECIGCAACIDACDGVMDKMQHAAGLIRYATQNAMQQRWSTAVMWKRVFRPRVLVYGAVLLAIVAAFVASLAVRAPLKADIVRDRGALARMVQDGRIENVYKVQLMNATERTIAGPHRGRRPSGRDARERRRRRGRPTEARWVPVAVQLPNDAARALGPGAHPMQFRIALLESAAGSTPARSDHPAVHELHEKSTFVVPR
jgi:Pyruvate/2-oxoacid:ferredoxin oxidoreductase delta subunit